MFTVMFHCYMRQTEFNLFHLLVCDVLFLSTEEQGTPSRPCSSCPLYGEKSGDKNTHYIGVFVLTS